MKVGKCFTHMLLVAIMLSIFAGTSMEIKAGKTEIQMDAKSLQTAGWNNPEGDVKVKEGKLTFPKDSTKYTRFIAKKPIKIEKNSKYLAKFSATVCLEKMPQREKFIMAFGLDSIESLSSEAESIEVAFVNSGGIKIVVCSYDEEGKKEELVAPKECGISVNKAVNVKIDITTENLMQISIDNRKICETTLPINAEGRFGFLQTRECGVVISNVSLTHYEYDTPENTNIAEDFEKGALDSSKLTAKMLWSSVGYPMGQVVEDYKGNQVLMHRNTGCAYIGTTYTYSNFEMTFDVPYLKVTKELKEDGRLESAGFDKLMVTIGGERADWDGMQWELSAETITLENGILYSDRNKEIHFANLEKNPFEKGTPFSMKVKMVDSILTIGMKWMEEDTFQTILQYQLKGGTPTGYIHIWAPQDANFAIDNLVITNLDEGANVMETEYVSGQIRVPKGEAPEEPERVYAEEEKKQEKWYWLPLATFFIGGVVFLSIACITRKKRGNVLVVLLLSAVMLSGCGLSQENGNNPNPQVMEPEESKAVSISFLGGQDVMPITGYIGPYEHSYSQDGNVFPNYISDEYYQLIADSGINLIVYSFSDYKNSPEAVIKNLELGEKYGIGMFVTDGNVTGKIEQEEITAREVAEEIVKYSDYESFCGMYVVDEPQATYYQMGDGSRLIGKYEKIAKVLHNELDIITYCNAFPITEYDEFKDDYEKYIDEFCDTLQPKMLCWDYYPFDKHREENMQIYFYNMDLIRREAQERGKPFWAYIQAGSQWNDEFNRFDSEKPYYPNKFQFDWNVNTSLAFGAQGIQYFPLIQPYQFTLADEDIWDFERNGILGAMGNKTQWYYFAQDINKHIAAIDEVLMNSVSKGVIASGEKAKSDMALTTCEIKESFHQLQSVSGDAMVGCFNYFGKTALYVVNYSYKNAQKITLTFDGEQHMKMIQNAETFYVKGKTATLDMAAGEGILLVLE